MYYNLDNIKCTCFSYKNKSYPAGTKFVYNGECILNGKAILLNNTTVVFMYDYKQNKYFKDDDNIYMCPSDEFVNHIVQIGELKKKEEHYWTDEDVAKTIWYICIMLFGTLFYARLGIWIIATVIWYCSIFKKK